MDSSHRTRIAVLGWGSLLWEVNESFDKYHEDWKSGGPTLPIEFSRVSRSRGGALTLVLDPDNGVQLPTWYAVSTRDSFTDAICDLRCREDTTIANIGFINRVTNETNSRLESVAKVVRVWAEASDFGVVIWTDLSSNFYQRIKKPFSTTTAMEYLDSLNATGKAKAREYITRARQEVVTPLRTFLGEQGWPQQAG